MSIEIRPISAAELEAFQWAMSVPFLSDPTPERMERYGKNAEIDRLRAAFDGDQIVATSGSYSFQLAVPGNLLPAAGTSVISVLPTHRRSGLLRRLMKEHLAEVHQKGEPLAALWASESSIYGRFGYGPASERAVMKLDKSFARMREPVDLSGAMRLVDSGEAKRVFPGIFDEVARRRPGMYLRGERWWDLRILSDPEEKRRGGTAHRRVLHVRDGRPVGYCFYRTRSDPEQRTTQVLVVELIGIDAPAEKALWQYLFNLDLTTSIDYWNQPVDDPLRWWLVEPRRMERKIEESLWVRMVDVRAALEGRRYAQAGSLGFQIVDPLCSWNEGSFRLEVGDDGRASCRRALTDAPIALTASALAAVYLGGHRFRDLARAGLIQGTPAALERADALFNWDPLPWCHEIF